MSFGPMVGDVDARLAIAHPGVYEEERGQHAKSNDGQYVHSGCIAFENNLEKMSSQNLGLVIGAGHIHDPAALCGSSDGNVRG